LVNPYDQEAMAAAIDQALSMPLEERKARHGALVKVLSENDIKDWGTRFIAALVRPAPVAVPRPVVPGPSYLAAAE
jgi:trehalose 6-phosphate synthase